VKRIWIAAVLEILLVAGLGSAQSAAGTLIVQLVEPGWLPVPNMTIRLTPVMNCTPGRRPTSSPIEKNTDKTGQAAFAVSGKSHYLINVPKSAGFAARSSCVQLFDFPPDFSTAYVQVRLNVAGPRVVVRE